MNVLIALIVGVALGYIIAKMTQKSIAKGSSGGAGSMGGEKRKPEL